MKKIKLTIPLIILLGFASLSFAATPSKPYADLVDNDVLTATWLIGTFNIIYNWAQATNASVTMLMAGTSFGDPITASLTTSVSSPTQYLIWDATALNYVSIAASGVYAFDTDVIAIASGGPDAARFHFQGTMIANGTQTAFIGDVITSSWFTASTYNASCAILSGGKLQFFASSPANVKWKGRLQAHEKGY